jgi:hypothetical protein
MNDGITRRDLFIAAALQGLMANDRKDALDANGAAVLAVIYGNQTDVELRVTEENEAAADRVAASQVREKLLAEDRAAANADRETFYAGAAPRWATPPAPELPWNPLSGEG